jgi:glycosyltransferase involved in cell wall biosynthesis
MKILFLSQFHGSWIEEEISILKELQFQVYYVQYFPKFKIRWISEFIRAFVVFVKSLPIVRRVDIIYSWWSFTLSFMGVLLAKIFKKKIIINVIGFELFKENWNFRKWGALHSALNRALITFVIRNATQVITISHQNAKQIRSLFGIDPKVVYEGIDISKFSKNLAKINKINENVHTPILLTVVTLSLPNIYRKGCDVLLRALATLLSNGYKLELIIVGEKLDGYQELCKLIRDLKINNYVKFTGRISDEDLLELYSKCDIYVQPSRQEGFPTTLVEAMACGKPIISTAIPSVREVVRNNREGILVPSNDPSKLAEAVINVLSDTDLMKKLSTNAQVRAKMFSKYIRKRELKKVLVDVFQNVKN